jgi:hypothetical protein
MTDMSMSWVPYSDFLSHLPTVRTRSYDNLLSNDKVQQMSSDDALFYFIITDVARKGQVAPIECVEEDIRRMLYAERRAEIITRYEEELRREAVDNGRVTMLDTVLLNTMSYRQEAESVAEEAMYGDEDVISVEEIEADSLLME